MTNIFKAYIEELDYTKFVFLDLGRCTTIQEDRRKHAAHDAVCEEVIKNFQVLGYTGSLTDRQQIGKFICIKEGRKDLVAWAN